MADERTEDELVESILGVREPTAEEKERDLRLAKRRELSEHVDWLLRLPARFYEQLETAIELAAEGRLDERIVIEGERVLVSELIASWELEDLVERARKGEWGQTGWKW